MSGTDASSALIHLMLFNGRRELLPADAKVFLRITDNNQKIIVSQNLMGPVQRISVPFTDGPNDTYTVLASADGYKAAGFVPVKVNPTLERTVFLMLIPSNGTFNFADSTWERLPVTHPDLVTFLSRDAPSAQDAKTRYDNLLEQSAPCLACLLNIVTVMRDIDLPQLTPFAYFKQLIWTGEFAPRQDRFFAWADRKLVTQVRTAAQQGAWAQEDSPGLLHPGATTSYKQIQFGEANLQLTFHETAAPPPEMPSGEDWVMVEPDIDYFRDLTAHALLEVIPGFFTLTDPKGVYVLRWIAGRQAHVPEFNPPYVIA